MPSCMRSNTSFWPLVQRAGRAHFEAAVDPHVLANLTKSARDRLVQMLFKELSGLCAPALYERFSDARKTGQSRQPVKSRNGAGTSCYDQFVLDMKADGFANSLRICPCCCDYWQ